MKTRITLFLLISFSLASCTKFTGGGTDDDLDQKSEISTYEGFLYAIHLKAERENLELRRDELNTILKNNQEDNNTKKELEETVFKLEQNEAEFANIIDVNELVGIIIPPFPPCPRGRCDDVPFPYNQVLSQKSAEAYVQLYDKNSNPINKNDQLKPFENSKLKDIVSVQNISNIEKFSGELIVLVERKNLLGETITYKIEGFVKK